MRWINFKKKVKEDLYEYESAGDGLDIWDSISGEVDALNAKNKKEDHRYLLLLLFLIGSLGAAYLIISSSQDSQKVYPESEIARNTKANTRHDIEDQTYHPRVIAKQSISSPEKNITDVKNKKTIGEKFAQIKDSSLTLNNIEKRNTANNGISSITRKNAIKGISISDINSSSSLKSNKKDNIGESTEKEIELINSKQIASSVIKNHKTLATDNNLRSYTLVEETNESTSSSSTPTILKEESNSISIPLSNIASLLLKEFKIETSKDLPTRSYFPDHNIATKIKSTNKFNIGVNAGVFYTHKQLTAKDTDGSSLLAARESTEQTLETIRGRIYGEYTIQSNLSISVGIDYTRINERFRFVEAEQNTQLINGVRYIFTGTGVNPTRLDEIGQIIETTTTTTDYTLYNNYELIDIPMLISYKWNKNKWSYGIQTGVIANLSLKGTGRILTSETNMATITAQDIFKKSLGLSYALNLVLEHRLNNSISIILSPSMRYFPNSFTKDSYSLTQKYQLIGGDIGMKYYFKNNFK